ncbi:PREDICTED: histone-lysine N-methyltransferase EHMT2-like [Branchiostoma belcheri]|uniref:Histone-lysine N-methyltransferase EHMT2-like n=1 Tax=Branchiostoma belcheri TaxID=7741 RepID=A0A6P4YCX9_BRABE|nr:PREDICTED: histone-lysine N-methyltransferase EHMT2-like [Branchiostoma belcheri]
MLSYKFVCVDLLKASQQEQTCGSDAPPCVSLKGGSSCLVPVKREEDPESMVTSGQPGSSFALDRTDNMQRAYRLNQREQIILDLQVHHLDTQASSSVMGINKEIRMLKGALQQTKRSTGSSADVLETSARERQEAAPEPRRIMMYGAWVGQRSLRTRSTLQSELMRNAARMRRRYERGHVEEEEEEDLEEEKEEQEENKDMHQDKTSVEDTETRKPRTQSLPTRPKTPDLSLDDLTLRPSSEPGAFRRRKREQNCERMPLLSRPKSTVHKKMSTGTQSSQDFEEVKSLSLKTQTKGSLNDEKSSAEPRTIGRLSSSKVDLSSIASVQERKNALKTTKDKLDHPSRPLNEKPTTLSYQNRRATKDSPVSCQTKAPNKIQNSSTSRSGYYEPAARPFSADVAHLRHKLEKSRIHFGWTRGGQRHAMTSRPRTSSDVTSPSGHRELDQCWGVPSDLYSHDSHDNDDSRPSTRAGTWSFLTDATTKGGKKSHSNCYPSNRTKKSSNADRGFPAKPRKSPRRGRRKSRLRATKVKQQNAYDIWVNNFK